MHFDGNDTTGSAEEGYGEQVWPNQINQQIQMDYTCRISDNFKQDMYLNPNGTIQIKLDFNIDSDNCNDQSECQNLTLTLYKGGIELAKQQFAAVDTNGNLFTWGYNGYGQLGKGNTNHYYYATRIPASVFNNEKILYVICSGYQYTHTFVITESGKCWSTGY